VTDVLVAELVVVEVVELVEVVVEGATIVEVVELTNAHMHDEVHASRPPCAEPQMLKGGSQSSPGSITPLPQELAWAHAEEVTPPAPRRVPPTAIPTSARATIPVVA